jgi:opacity protein-like surface antigen
MQASTICALSAAHGKKVRPRSVHRSSTHKPRFAWASVAGVILITALPLRQTQAEGSPGLYLEGAFGQAKVAARGLPDPFTGTTRIGDFKENHSAYQVAVGARPISLVGAELAYFDFGHPRAIVGSIATPIIGVSDVSGDVAMKGSAAFGILYLPVPILDVYVKAGLARIESTARTTVTLSGPILCIVGHPQCQFSQQHETTNTGFAAGAGAQYKLGRWAARAEYERFNADGAHPSLLSLGIAWTFF